MYISPDNWTALEGYLFLDLKLSEKPQAKQAVASRFRVLSHYFSSHKLHFTRQNFLTFIQYMKDHNYSNSHMNNMIKMGKHIDKFYNLQELQDFTYFHEKKPLNYDILTPDEIHLLANVQVSYSKMSCYINARQKALIYLLGSTGCRIGEALDLKRSDLYFNPPHVLFRDTKNGTDRAVPIIDSLLKDLLVLSCGKEYVFTSGRGGRLDVQQVNLDLKRRAEASGIKKHIWAHLFRHSYITTMLESGVDISDVGVLVGHTDPKSTMRYKNSQLEHYSNIILMNPLLRRSLTLDIIGKRVSNLIIRLVDREAYSISQTETKNEFIIRIRKT